MRRILVGVDGSEAALHAAQKAAEFAARLDAEVTCAYVIPPPFYPPEATYVPLRQMMEADRKLAEDVVTKAAEAVRATYPRVDTQVLQGPPAETLARTAEHSPEVELVVVGSRGRNALSRVLLGSVADRVVHLSKKPVLVVR